jgi:hypothetical protein
MSDFAGSRTRLLIWAFVKLFLTVCGRQDDATDAISSDQPLTLSVVHVAREALNGHVR